MSLLSAIGSLSTSSKSPLAPFLCASLCFVSAYLYLLVAGKNIPFWVYVFLAAMVGMGRHDVERVLLSAGLEQA